MPINSKGVCILVVDDDPAILITIGQQLNAMGFRVITASNAAEANEVVQASEIALVLLDLFLADSSGTQLLLSWRNEGRVAPVIVISGSATIPDAVDAIKSGAYDFLVKPIDMSILEAVIGRALYSHKLQAENKRLRRLTQVEQVEFVGVSDTVKCLLAEARKVAHGESPILLEGETGTGKQVLAKYIHSNSDRADEPFVSVNCAAITESLFESELFGHEKGAFTSAVSRKPGKFELVGHGTLFLDEIGELPLLCQAKVLTAVEDRVFERVGGTTTLRFSGRVIAATNRDICAEVNSERFRKDLFFRLSTYHLKLPPLRQHTDDIEVYVRWAIERYRRLWGKEIRMPSERTLSILAKYSWPGNVRELLHHVERVVLMADKLHPDDGLWLSFPTLSPLIHSHDCDDLRGAIEGFRRRHIQSVVARCGGNQTEASKLLGIERTHLNRLIALYDGRKSP